MTAVRAFLVGLREVFWLENAEERARALGTAERERRQRFSAAARARRAVARKSSSAPVAVVLLRDALELALRAPHADGDFDLVTALERARLDTRMPNATSRVLELLVLDSPLAVDDLSFAEAESLREAFDDCVAAALGEARAPSVFSVRALRIGRALGAVLLVAWVVSSYVRTHFLVHNVALGKLVTSSPLRGESPTPDHLVDGRTRGTYGLATTEVEHPFVDIDLEQTYVLDHVVVYNRGDGWFDDSLPLVLSVSDNGVRFEEIARRDDHFVTWRVDLGQRRERVVRLSMPHHGYIALNEVEVYGRAVR